MNLRAVPLFSTPEEHRTYNIEPFLKSFLLLIKIFPFCCKIGENTVVEREIFQPLIDKIRRSNFIMTILKLYCKDKSFIFLLEWEVPVKYNFVNLFIKIWNVVNITL